MPYPVADLPADLQRWGEERRTLDERLRQECQRTKVLNSQLLQKVWQRGDRQAGEPPHSTE